MLDESCWLTPQEQDDVCKILLRFGLIKWSNSRDLPLKGGGTTDIYINLREARRSPEAIRLISRHFANPLLRLDAECFAEVPDSVSCFAGPLSIETRLPYLTIRENPKEGRVAGAKTIGEPRPGSRTVIFDDVITDGASKLSPYHECIRLGLNIIGVVVLVDRQEGWRNTFTAHNIPVDVWAGMTLHDVRKFLIENDIMKRCDKAVEEKNPLIIALDGKEWEEILPILDQIRTTGCILKVNDLLFYEGIKSLIPDLSVYGRVMADLKGHDIPRTVSNTCRRLAKTPPWAVTVHSSGGREMVRAAAEALKSTSTKVLGVTVLTSIDSDTCKEVYTRLPLDEVKVLAQMALEAGADGLVCSPEEVRELRSLYPKIILVTPGVRSANARRDDQKRIGTPASAMESGADHLVMGSQIFGAEDPVAEVKRIIEEELGIT